MVLVMYKGTTWTWFYGLGGKRGERCYRSHLVEGLELMLMG